MPLSKGKKAWQTRQRNQIKFVQQTMGKYLKIMKKEDSTGYAIVMEAGPHKVSFWSGFIVWLFKSGRVKGFSGRIK